VGNHAACTQKIAAFWSTSRPALLGSLGVSILWTRAFSGDAVYANPSLIALAGYLAFFAFQPLLTRRLVRKDYRSFRLHVVRDDCSKSRNLSIPEAVTIDLCEPKCCLQSRWPVAPTHASCCAPKGPSPQSVS
jgi:hypothetical protein